MAAPRWDDAAAQALAARLRLHPAGRRRRQDPGARLGAGPGASLEFHDHRDYLPGDDPRHIDWNVLARTGSLVLRRHQQEVSPRVEILLDASASMAVTDAKAALALGLVALLTRLAEAEGARVRLWALADAARRLGEGARGAWLPALTSLRFEGRAGLELTPGPPLASGSERLVVSDGLCPGGADAVVRRLGRDAGSLTLVQVLTDRERDPTPLGPVRLEDVEGGGLDVVLDQAACDAYKGRLARHQDGWRRALSGRGAGLVTCSPEAGLEAAAQALVAAGLLEARLR